MCGRLFAGMSMDNLRRISRCSAVRNPERHQTSYNVAPTSYIPCITKKNKDCKMKANQNENIEVKNVKSDPQTCIEKQEESKKQETELEFLQWGMKTPFSFIINARSEEAEQKTTFQPLLKEQRCIVITQGYYEWTPNKQPYIFWDSEANYLLLAALKSKNNDEVLVLTREAFGEFDAVHHRMPVFLENEEIDLWLDETISYNDALKTVYKDDKPVHKHIQNYKCSTLVNNVRENSIKCLMNVKEYEEHLKKNGISRFFQQKIPKEKQTEVPQNTPQQLKIDDNSQLPIKENKSLYQTQSSQMTNTQNYSESQPNFKDQTSFSQSTQQITQSYYQSQQIQNGEIEKDQNPIIKQVTPLSIPSFYKNPSYKKEARADQPIVSSLKKPVPQDLLQEQNFKIQQKFESLCLNGEDLDTFIEQKEKCDKIPKITEE